MLKGVVPKEMTAEARRRIFEPTDEEREKGAGSLGSAPEITDLINKSRFSDLIQNTIGEFDPPQSTQVGVTPANSTQVRAPYSWRCCRFVLLAISSRLAS